jgi:hypothetical protein
MEEAVAAIQTARLVGFEGSRRGEMVVGRERKLVEAKICGGKKNKSSRHLETERTERKGFLFCLLKCAVRVGRVLVSLPCFDSTL